LQAAPAAHGSARRNVTKRRPAAASNVSNSIATGTQKRVPNSKPRSPTFGLLHEDRAQARGRFVAIGELQQFRDLHAKQRWPCRQRCPARPPVIFIANNAPHEYLSQGNVHEVLDVSAFASWAARDQRRRAGRASAGRNCGARSGRDRNAELLPELERRSSNWRRPEGRRGRRSFP